MNDPSLVQLALAFPPPAERPLLALLLELDPGLGGFSTVAAAGHGHGFDNASVQELVRGHADRRLLLAVMPRASAERLLEGLRERMSAAGITWWLTPVLDFGRLA
ncbi:DUF3240 family protein [Luteimonas granuli]|uniref:DUF3240 domain-containing protein n=1 Tax=Luteimonas granuli TaxID=1176533 RepID=A0A518N108_9GAMM|nr:DUF3240 family protein [Luteimonas granuli]QDW65607.1 DUF3240 domain-containing protein [Luteimonas granuli]